MPGVSMAGGLPPGLEHTAYFTPDQSTYSNGTHVAEVEVDVETGGGRRSVRYHVMHDCGNVINPMVVEGQVDRRRRAWRRQRAVRADGLRRQRAAAERELRRLSAAGLDRRAAVDIVHMETPSPLNPLGVKGAGEGGTIPAIAAIIAAVENALSPFGVKINEAPVSPARIVALIAEAKARAK